MKDGALVCNTGHYDCEINLGDLEARAKGKREIRAEQRGVHAQGRPPHLRARRRAAWSTSPPPRATRREVMDMSFANQYLALCRLAKDGKSMKPACTSCRPSRTRSWPRSS